MTSRSTSAASPNSASTARNMSRCWPVAQSVTWNPAGCARKACITGIILMPSGRVASTTITCLTIDDHRADSRPPSATITCGKPELPAGGAFDGEVPTIGRPDNCAGAFHRDEVEAVGFAHEQQPSAICLNEVEQVCMSGRSNRLGFPAIAVARREGVVEIGIDALPTASVGECRLVDRQGIAALGQAIAVQHALLAMRDKRPVEKRQNACAAQQMLRLAGDRPADDPAIAGTPERAKGEWRRLVEGRNGIADIGSGQ